jgi:hypothetical protein
MGTTIFEAKKSIFFINIKSKNKFERGWKESNAMVERRSYYCGKKIKLWWKESRIRVERNSYNGGKKLYYGGKKIILGWKDTPTMMERKSYYGGKETHIGTLQLNIISPLPFLSAG